MTYCPKCNEKECLWITHGKDVVSFAGSKRGQRDYANNVLRKFAYQEAVRCIYGVMGNGNRVELPECVLDGVRQEYPDKNNSYMGYMSE